MYEYSFVYVSFLRGGGGGLLFVSVMELTLKSCLGSKKQHGFVAYSVTNRMRPSTKKKVKDTRNLVYLNSAALL